MLLVEPAYTKTGFDADAMQADMPLPVYAQQRRIFGDVLAEAMKDGDDPAIVAKVIVAAATDPRPKLRYTACPVADASARCAASPPGPSTGRSASSTSWRRTPAPQPRQQGTPAGAAFPQDAGIPEPLRQIDGFNAQVEPPRPGFSESIPSPGRAIPANSS